MSISINKVINDKQNTLMTEQYGLFNIVESINTDKYTHFDTINNFKLFIEETGENKVAISSESESINSINNEIEKIKSTYNGITTIKYDDVERAIIIHCDEKNSNILDKLENDYKNNSNYKIERITATVIFLNLINSEIQLEEDELLNKLDDNTIKDLATKTGTKLSGSESKDELKGIIKGALNSK